MLGTLGTTGGADSGVEPGVDAAAGASEVAAGTALSSTFGTAGPSTGVANNELAVGSAGLAMSAKANDVAKKQIPKTVVARLNGLGRDDGLFMPAISGAPEKPAPAAPSLFWRRMRAIMTMAINRWMTISTVAMETLPKLGGQTTSATRSAAF